MAGNTDFLETARTLNSSAIHLLRGLWEVDREAGLSRARLSALSVLVFGGPSSLGRLARAEGVAGPTMTRIVDGLCEGGLARRDSHPDNPRMTLVSATAAGEKLMHHAANRRFDTIIRAMSVLPQEDQDALSRGAPALRRLVEIMSDDR